MRLTFQLYSLADGTIVAVDATAAKGAPTIDYTQADGSIVTAAAIGATFEAIRRDELTCSDRHALYEYRGLDRGTGYRLLCPVCDAAYIRSLQRDLAGRSS